MKLQPLIVTEQLYDKLVWQFKDYLKEHSPETYVLLSYKVDFYRFQGGRVFPKLLVFLPHYGGRVPYEMARAIHAKGHTVFLLEHGLHHNRASLHSGLVGVISRLPGQDSGALLKDGPHESAAEVLKQYLS